MSLMSLAKQHRSVSMMKVKRTSSRSFLSIQKWLKTVFWGINYHHPIIGMIMSQTRG